MKHCAKHDEDYNEIDGCDGCEAELEFAPPASSHSFSVTCNECGYSGSIEAIKLHSCQIQEQGGRCEDFPACGHTDGDGCQHQPQHTSEFWMDLYTRYPDQDFDDVYFD